MLKKILLIMMLLCISLLTHAEELISCYDEKIKNSCELVLKETQYTFNLLDVHAKQPYFKEDLIGGMFALVSLYKFGNNYLFIRKSRTQDGTNQAVLFHYSDKKITVLNYLDLGYYFIMDVVPGERKWTGFQCELNLTISNNAPQDNDIFGISQDKCNKLLDKFPIELEKDIGDVFQIRSYANDKVKIKKAFFIFDFGSIDELVCIQHCDTLNTRFYGKIDDAYPFIMNYDFESKKHTGAYYYLKHNKPIQLLGDPSKKQTVLYGLDNHKNKTESFTLSKQDEGYEGIWTNLKDKTEHPVLLYPMFY